MELVKLFFIIKFLNSVIQHFLSLILDKKKFNIIMSFSLLNFYRKKQEGAEMIDRTD